MKIIFATPLYPPEIAEPAPYVKELAKRLCDKHTITTVAYTNTHNGIHNAKLLAVNKSLSLPVRLFQYTFTLYKASRGADIIYAQDTLAAGLPAIIAGYLRNIPVILRMVGDESWKRATQLHLTTQDLETFLSKPPKNKRIKLTMWLQGFVLRHAQTVITPSKHTKNIVVRTYNTAKENTIVIYNPPPRTEILPFDSPVVKHQIVADTRLVKWKGVAGIIHATSILKKEFPDIQLYIIGEGPEKINLERLTQKYNISENTVLLGHVSHAEKWHIHKSSEVSIINADHEDIPDAAYLDFMVNTPVITTNVPGINEIVCHKRSGLTVEAGNTTNLVEAIRCIFTDNLLYSHVTEEAQKIMEEKISWDIHTAHVLQTFLKQHS